MNLIPTLEETTLTLAIEGSIDTVTAPVLEAELQQRLGGVTSLIFDFARVDYISSAGLRVLIATSQTMEQWGTMVIRNANEDVREVFEMTGFDELLTLE